MIYLFHGGDDLSRDEALVKLLARIREPMGDLNQIRLDPSKLTFAQLRQACDAMPFLSDRRIIIIEGLIHKLAKRGPKAFVNQFKDYLSQVPDYTRLFLLEGEVDKRTTLWKTLNKYFKEKPPIVYIKEFPQPSAQQLPHWIRERASKHGGQIERDAATQLATFVADNMRLLDQEICKLVTYAGQRHVTVRDVRLLVPYVQEASVWEMVDAIGAMKPRKALMTAQQILEDDPSKAIYLHVMITRQIRMLLQVAELVALGKKANEIPKILRMKPFVFRKVMPQVKNFTVSRLERAYDLLLQADVDMKSGADQPMTINLLIVELARR
jgi:DNA polymerase-3 subunit delta